MASEAEEVASAAMIAAFDQIDELARWLFSLQNPGAVFAAEDEVTRLFWRKTAQRKLQESLRLGAESAT